MSTVFQVEFLCDRGADVNRGLRSSSLHYAACFGRPQIVKVGASSRHLYWDCAFKVMGTWSLCSAMMTTFSLSARVKNVKHLVDSCSIHRALSHSFFFIGLVGRVCVLSLWHVCVPGFSDKWFS